MIALTTYFLSSPTSYRSENNQMVINEDKCKLMIFNTVRKYDATTRSTLSCMGENDHLEVVESVKLLGIIIKSDLQWCEIMIICAKKAIKDCGLLGGWKCKLIWTVRCLCETSQSHIRAWCASLAPWPNSVWSQPTGEGTEMCISCYTWWELCNLSACIGYFRLC